MSHSLAYTNKDLLAILQDTKTIAMVGASPKWNRPSFFAMKYLQEKGYRVIPVNPGVAGKEILGETVYASLAEIPGKFEMVDIFRNSAAAGPITEEAIAVAKKKGIKVIWMQLDVINHEAACKAEAAGLTVVMNRCPKIEFGRLNAELSWGGFNSGIITAKRRRVRLT
ncbi:CoA-binding protein [Pelagibius litoralis]|uniref:CoA-binding protein n=1 Tax=Pelagibius litoralis TaxID=374515 RepID=A0A967C2S2_9PROT|nr:CoA-binding protein [Pelagibius litoralis]NIA67065.1 CoA-binding protein [Pelagibius litoralis]